MLIHHLLPGVKKGMLRKSGEGRSKVTVPAVVLKGS
jgi:hypothetical protein